MVSFMNGLAAAGAGLADFAGKAGLEYQRSDLAQQQLVLANTLAMTRDTANNQFTAGEHALDRSSKRADLEYSETHADTRSADANRTSRENNAATNQTSITTAGMNNAGADKRNQDTIKFETEKFTKTLDANNEVTVDANTGNAISINKGTGKVTPILDSKGDPVRLPDNEATKGLTTLLNTTNEELRAANARRAQDITAAQRDLDETSRRIDLLGPDKDKEIARRRQALTDIQRQHDITIQALNNRLAATASRLLALRPGQNAGAAPGDRPPLDGILTTPNAAPTNAVSSGLLNGGGQ